MIITFCGHGSVPDDDSIRKWLEAVLEPFLDEDEVIFFLGGYGGFDRLAASVARQSKIPAESIRREIFYI